MSVRWDSLPPGVRVRSSLGGEPRTRPQRMSPAERDRLLRESNRAAKLRQGTADRASFIVFGPFPTTNALLRMNPLTRHPVISGWVRTGEAEGLLLPAIVGRVGVDVYAIAGPRGGIADASGRSLVVKSILDGLVLAGVLENDSPEFVAWERHHAATERGPEPLLRIELVPAA